MVDIFPFPSITEKTPEKQIGEIVNYLTQFKETLEFAITNISTDNLSTELIGKLNELGADIEKNEDDRKEETAQISNKFITVSDVCNSEIFKAAVKSESIKNVKFNVNFVTGDLEYSEA